MVAALAVAAETSAWTHLRLGASLVAKAGVVSGALAQESNSGGMGALLAATPRPTASSSAG
jgi:hypothetical protein